MSFHMFAKEDINQDKICEALALDRLAYDDSFQLGYVPGVFCQESRYLFHAQDDGSGHMVDVDNRLQDFVAYQEGSRLWGCLSLIVVHPCFRGQGVARGLSRMC